MQKNLAFATLVLGSSLLFASSASAVGITSLFSFDGTNGDFPSAGLTQDNNSIFYGTI